MLSTLKYLRPQSRNAILKKSSVLTPELCGCSHLSSNVTSSFSSSESLETTASLFASSETLASSDMFSSDTLVSSVADCSFSETSASVAKAVILTQLIIMQRVNMTASVFLSLFISHPPYLFLILSFI